MTLKDKKITSYEDNISALSNFPSDDGITPDQLKAMFDGRTDKEVKESINAIIDALCENTAGQLIKCSDGETVEDKLNKKANTTQPEFSGDIMVHDSAYPCRSTTVYNDGRIVYCDENVEAVTELMLIPGEGRIVVSDRSTIYPDYSIIGDVYTTISHPNLDLTTAILSESEKSAVRDNIGVTALIGDIGTAIDALLAVQATYIGGESA